MAVIPIQETLVKQYTVIKRTITHDDKNKIKNVSKTH